MKEDIKNEKYIKNSPIPVSLENTEKIINQMKKCVCQIHKKGQGTGFLCKIPYPDASQSSSGLLTPSRPTRLVQSRPMTLSDLHGGLMVWDGTVGVL